MMRRIFSLIFTVCAVVPAIAAAEVDKAHYTLGPGDKVRVTVFGEPELSGAIEIGPEGNASLPLIGDVAATGKTLAQFRDEVDVALRTYVRRAQINVDIAEYRPFFIIGEVKLPGTYPYSANLTVNNAVARAGGFTDRAAKGKVFIKRFDDTDAKRYPLTDSTQVRPGDTIRIGERLF